jgi:hypothetical protein
VTPLAARLATLAAQGNTITYGDLARDLGLRMGALTAQLEILMEDDAAAGRPFRAALCAARLSPDGLPAPGFFAKAASLGCPTADSAAMVRDHRARLFAGL